MSAKNIYVKFRQLGTNPLAGRATARNGTGWATGAATGVNGEGYWLKIADVSTITREILSTTSAGVVASVNGPTSVTVATAITDTPVTSQVNWTADTTGYNFLDDAPASYFTDTALTYTVRYKVTLSGGNIVWLNFIGPLVANQEE